MRAVILAAGVGSRLGRPFPKALSILPTGETIMGRQIRLFREAGIREVVVVVGFKKTLIMEQHPNAYYRYNPVYYITNTSKSLLCAIEDLDDDVLWVNGDVVFDPGVIAGVIDADHNVIAVDRKKCGDEEVKYRTNGSGTIIAISKTIENGEGEAVGVNKVLAAHVPALVRSLELCEDQDYFERGLEYMIRDKVAFRPLDISEHRCIEVDFPEDWQEAQQMFAG
ncbi:phosphocholine cytidylyltransferase family protein [Oceanidesulfovibrio indonesiensis]|uniref:Phosphocholine cytidylyltransferase family protein n=1 Tax=Oceanidesulfovibrio indonesiensis TaxID=54767 RepID=A0A7M3MB55_9BACT|nr:phosphocholine cytidylyltransferase family protein [Oceanidesulfovibrio indonesiensis]TVM15335.1 phosphocholine cytidylyltransferase family protein [Oceanidesulfovibrio indonesiensis]